MNLLHKTVETTHLQKFRLEQYSKIPEIIITGANYLTDLGLEYDDQIFDQTINSLRYIEDRSYTKTHHYATIKVSLKLIDSSNYFLYMSVPELKSGMFFKINGVYYVPIYYITDEPIISKKGSVKLQALFSPITIYFDDNRVTFMGMNIVISDFLQLFSGNWDSQTFNCLQQLGISFQNTIDNIVIYLSSKFNTPPNVDDIKERMNQLFFDEWTKKLYQRFYNFEPTLENVIKVTLHRRAHNKKPSFVDLRYKRLSFIEPLMTPYCKAVSEAAKGLLKGNNIKGLNLLVGAIINLFFAKLDGNVLYDTTNSFSGILAYKATFKNPYGEGKLPKEVSSIHWTHKGRICPNSIANNDPGEGVFLVPDQIIDTEFGIFQFSEDELSVE